MREDNTPTGSARKRKPSSKLKLRLETAKKIQKLNADRKSNRQKKREAKLNAAETDPAKHVSIHRVPRIKKNVLAKPPQAISKFKRRQVNKTWLPTHLWHTKRAHLTRPTVPLWRMAIPLRPTEKTYRPIHRASGARGCVAWDTSYMSTIGCRGTQAALQGLLKALNFVPASDSPAKQRRWVAGTRFAEGWVKQRDNQKRLLAQITVMWKASDAETNAELAGAPVTEDSRKRPKLNDRLFIIVHPSTFHSVWHEVVKVAKMQKPQVLVEDLRFEIGSITVIGPESTEALVGVLKLTEGHKEVEKVWHSLASVRNPASLPLHAMLNFDVVDPRYNRPPKQVRVAQTDAEIQKVNELIVTWPTDNTTKSSRLFSQRERYIVSKSLRSQKAVNRRRIAALTKSVVSSVNDPRIPIMLLAHRSPNHDSTSQGSWTVLMPWSCVDLVWRSLVYYPLSSGSTPRFGGLEQTQQVAFEHAAPWFPSDYPGLEAGKAWDRIESEKRFDAWVRRPPSKRFSYDAVELGLGRKGEHGRGWACDWEYLFKDTLVETSNGEASHDISGTSVSKLYPSLLTQRQRLAARRAAKEKEEASRRRNTSSPETEDEKVHIHNDVSYEHLEPVEAARLLKSYASARKSTIHTLSTVRVKFLTRGTPKAAARIYRLPVDEKGRKTSTAKQQEADNVSAGAKATSNADAPPRPILFSDTTTRPQITDSNGLRQRWLRLDPSKSEQNVYSSTRLPRLCKKERRNHHGDVVAHKVFDPKHTNDLSHIRVFPPNEKNPEVMNMFGPKPPPKTVEERMKVLQPQLVPKMIVNADGELVEESIWDEHVPCPGKEDLIGFVTTGGYSLAEGAGMAIGSVWMQRLIEGWKSEDSQKSKRESQASTEQGEEAQKESTKANDRSTSRQDQAQKSKEAQRKQKQIDRQRHLCIVRNAGESIGRLAMWELC